MRRKAVIGTKTVRMLYVNCPMAQQDWGIREMMYGALVLIGGGLGLIIAFIIEMKVRKPKD